MSLNILVSSFLRCFKVSLFFGKRKQVRRKNREGGWGAEYRVDQGFRLNLGKRSEMIIFMSLLTTFTANKNF